MTTEADFRMIRPVAVTDAILTSTTVPEATVSAYSSGTTYALGDRAGTTFGTVQTVYQSLQNANTGHTPASSPTWWKVVGVVYAAYAGGTTYAEDDIVSSIGTNVHLLYQSLVGSNTGNALTDETKWLAYGSTNARAMFDELYGSQTTNADTIVAVMAPGVLVNAVALGNIDAASATLSQSISGWSRTAALQSHPVDNWYDWFYEDLIRLTDYTFADVPPYLAGVLTLTLDNTGATAKCGVCVLGKSVTIGKTQWELIGGCISYSGTTTNAFGQTTFLPRAKVKELNLEVAIRAGFESEAYRLLNLYTDTPMFFIGSSAYALTQLYGFLGTWSVPISITGKKAPIQLKGLT